MWAGTRSVPQPRHWNIPCNLVWTTGWDWPTVQILIPIKSQTQHLNVKSLLNPNIFYWPCSHWLSSWALWPPGTRAPRTDSLDGPVPVLATAHWGCRSHLGEKCWCWGTCHPQCTRIGKRDGTCSCTPICVPWCYNDKVISSLHQD